MVLARRVAITGAMSYSGRYLTRLLLDEGVDSIVNLSSRPKPIAAHNVRAEHLERIEQRPLAFSQPSELARSLEGVDVLACTYWIRFARDGDTHAAAAARCASLFKAAQEAGVRKIVFTSHTRATVDSPFAYIAGKAAAVESLRELSARRGVNYAVARPCGIFGDTADESILMNNAACILRHVPLMPLAGDGSHRFQPVHVRDMAELLAELGPRSMESSGEEVDAVGPDCPTAHELFRRIASACGAAPLRVIPTKVMPSYLPPRLVVSMSKPIDWITGDVLLDGDDLDLLCSGLTVADCPEDPRIAGRRSLFAWLEEVGGSLGRQYVSSVGRYYQKG